MISPNVQYQSIYKGEKYFVLTNNGQAIQHVNFWEKVNKILNIVMIMFPHAANIIMKNNSKVI